MNKGGHHERASNLEVDRICNSNFLGIGLDNDRTDHGHRSSVGQRLSLSRERMQIIVGELYRRGLTKREVEVCVEFHDLPPNTVIMDRLGIANNTVTMHFHSIFRKLGVKNRHQLFGTLELLIQQRQPLPIGAGNFGGLPNGKIKG